MKKKLFALLSACCLAAGCASPPTRFYVLSPLAAQQPLGAGGDIAVGVGPLALPDYLDRPQIVTRSGQNELNVAEFERWGEPLKDNATEVLAENLAILLPSQKISVYPWKRSAAINYQVAAKIIRFDRAEAGEAVLSVRWSVLDGEGATLLSRESRYAENPAGGGHAATVAAMNQALARFSRDVAGALVGLRAGGAPPP